MRHSPRKIAFIKFIRCVCVPAQLVRPTIGNRSMEPFQIVLMIAEFGRQVIQQGFVAGGIGKTEIVDRFDDPNIEIPGPDTVNDRFREVRVILVPHPVHQCSARVFKIFDLDFFSTQNLGRSSCHNLRPLFLISLIVLVASFLSSLLGGRDVQLAEGHHLALVELLANGFAEIISFEILGIDSDLCQHRHLVITGSRSIAVLSS